MNEKEEAMHTEEYEVTPDGRVLSLSSNWRGYGVREMPTKCSMAAQ